MRKRPSRPRLGLTERLANLHLLLRASSFERWPLKVTFYAEDVYRVWKKWTEQHLETLRPGINVVLDSSKAVDHEKELAPALTGINALDVGYGSLKSHIEKSQQIFGKAEWLHCSICRKGVPTSGVMTLVCPSNACNAVYHMQCLSTHFLSGQSKDDLVPISSKCPRCNNTLQWIDLVKELSLRMRGPKEIAILFKKPRKAKGQLGAVVADAEGTLSAEEEELDDLDVLDDDWHELADSSDGDVDDRHVAKKRLLAPSSAQSSHLEPIIDDSDWDEAEIVS